MDNQGIGIILHYVFRRLLDRYGPQHWWPAEEPFEVIVGAILTQSTAWTNVEKAITSLKNSGNLSPAALRRLSDSELAGLIHSCGYYNVKARRLKSFVNWLGEKYDDDLDKMFTGDIEILRQALLSVYGIGEETADSIILYAGNRPTFVIDAYTRRIINRLGLTLDQNSYVAYQEFFVMNLPVDPSLFNEYHALLVRLGKDVCRTRPVCQNCCLNSGSKTESRHKVRQFPCSRIPHLI
jgi:endonuclease-3 related protein